MLAKTLFAVLLALAISSADVNAQCSTTRRRKDIKTLSSSERTALKNAFNVLYKNGTIKKYVDMHVQMSSVAHNRPEFLARHRLMVKLFEDELVSASNGGLEGLPYWDSTRDAANPRNSVVLSDSYMGTADPGCIKNGPAAGWVQDDGTCVERGFTGGSWASDNVVGGIASVVGKYSQFSNYIEYGPHAFTHNGIGGNMADLNRSPWDPIFWMHHSGVDFWWASWQAASTSNAQAYDGISFTMGPYTSADSIDYQGRLCYRYDGISSSNSDKTTSGTPSTPTGGPTTTNPQPTGTPSSDIFIPNFKDFSDSFVKSFNIPTDQIAQLEVVYKGVAAYLTALKAQGKPLPNLSNLRDVKLPKDLSDQINSSVTTSVSSSKKNNGAAADVELSWQVAAALVGAAGVFAV